MGSQVFHWWGNTALCCSAQTDDAVTRSISLWVGDTKHVILGSVLLTITFFSHDYRQQNVILAMLTCCSFLFPFMFIFTFSYSDIAFSCLQRDIECIEPYTLYSALYIYGAAWRHILDTGWTLTIVNVLSSWCACDPFSGQQPRKGIRYKVCFDFLSSFPPRCSSSCTWSRWHVRHTSLRGTRRPLRWGRAG